MRTSEARDDQVTDVLGQLSGTRMATKRLHRVHGSPRGLWKSSRPTTRRSASTARSLVLLLTDQHAQSRDRGRLCEEDEQARAADAREARDWVRWRSTVCVGCCRFDDAQQSSSRPRPDTTGDGTNRRISREAGGLHTNSTAYRPERLRCVSRRAEEDGACGHALGKYI